MGPARYGRPMTAEAPYVDRMMLAIQFIIHEEFLHIAKSIPDDTMLWHDGPLGPQPCARA
jgi:hypothetical protein